MTTLASAVTDLTTTIAEAALTRAAPAIGVAAGYEAPSAAISPRRAVALLRAIAADIAALDVVGDGAEAVRLGARAAALAQAVRVAVDIAYESRQDAQAVASALDADLAGAIDAAAEAALDAPGAGAALWSALIELRSRLARDLNEVIGRLPAVITVTPPYGISAWLVAHHYAGADPRAVIAMFDDIALRNRLRHPGLITADSIEVLP